VPKRTNDFQALIALVERQLAASGVRVVESEMLADRLTGELREVDVCVHATVSGKDVMLALECRDHKRKADQIWIDTLRGKYANLPVDKVIAVARAGFAKTARAAAEKARIQTLTLEEATSANWHLIAELPDAALVVAHFPVAENVSLHLVNGQEPIPDTMMVADVSLRLGDQTLPLATFCIGIARHRLWRSSRLTTMTLNGCPSRSLCPTGSSWFCLPATLDFWSESSSR
jgi:hypothetical protein